MCWIFQIDGYKGSVFGGVGVKSCNFGERGVMCRGDSTVMTGVCGVVLSTVVTRVVLFYSGMITGTKFLRYRPELES